MSARPGDEPPWEELFSIAQRTIDELNATLPAELKEHTKRLSLVLKDWPPEGQEVLGHCFYEEQTTMLYLGMIYEECEEFGLEFAEEVRITYLHELGHHLGLDEEDLEERGLL